MLSQKSSKSCSDDIFHLPSGISRPTSRRASACPNLNELWTQPAHVRCRLLSYWFSLWIWSIISRVVTVLGHPGWDASQVEKSPRLNWATQFLMVIYDGACSPYVCVRMAWISFGVLLCRKRNLMVARVLMLLKSCMSPDMLLFRLCNKKGLAVRHIKRPLFPTTLSIPS